MRRGSPGPSRAEGKKRGHERTGLVHRVGASLPLHVAGVHLVYELLVVVLRDLFDREVHRPQAEAYCSREPLLNCAVSKMAATLE